MLTLLIVRINISSLISGLISANKKLSLKNLILLFLSNIKKIETTIP